MSDAPGSAPEIKIKLWLFNRAAQIFGDSKVEHMQARLGDYAFTGYHSRPEHERPPGAHPQDVMTSGLGLDEYFVPIPYKCLGGLIEEPGPNGLFQKIKAYYERDGWNYRDYWDGEGYHGAKMFSPAYEGYYSMIRRDTEEQWQRHGIVQKNILVGYSQGGLVGRFLSYLDEYCFQRDHPTEAGYVHGLIMIATPNFGSPLGNDANKANIARAVQMIKMALFGLRETDGTTLFGNLEDRLTHPDSLDEFWNRFDGSLLALIQDCREILTRAQAEPDFLEVERVDAIQKLEAIANDVYKWTTGMRDSGKETAFYDMSILHLAEDDGCAVLKLVNENPLQRIPYGCILSGNADLETLINDFLPPAGAFLFSSLKSLQLQNVITQISDIFRAVAMQEQGPPELLSHPTIKQVTDEYKNGFRENRRELASLLTDYTVPPLQHDVIIPSSYQRIHARGDNFLGNWYSKSNHLSGSTPIYSEGRKNFKLACKMLGKIVARL